MWFALCEWLHCELCVLCVCVCVPCESVKLLDVLAYVATSLGCRGTGTRGRVKKGWSGFEEVFARGDGEGEGEPGAATARGR